MSIFRFILRIVLVSVSMAFLSTAVGAGDKCSCHCQTDDHHVYEDSNVLAEPLMYRKVVATVRWKTPDSEGRTEKTYELGPVRRPISSITAPMTSKKWNSR